VINFFLERKDKLIRFFIVGISLTLLNLLLIYVFVEIFLFNTKLLENIANIIVIEIGVIFSFFLNKNWTWNISSNSDVFNQLLKFHTVVASTAILRILLFALLQSINVTYIVNTILGIILASFFNFILYDLKVFNEKI
tara:strand:+ start:1300 stop:1713 length:414 start_codon:yes stop_codon:yes gene_type:complete